MHAVTSSIMQLLLLSKYLAPPNFKLSCVQLAHDQLRLALNAEAAYTPGHALEVGVRRKVAANLPSCRSVGVDFIPIVAETLGGLAEDTISTISTLGMAITQRVGPTTDDDSSPAIRQLFNKYAVTLWRGNATL